MIKGFIEHLGIKTLRIEGNQYVCTCPWCNSPKLYVNQTTGLWDCKHGCGVGNPYKLVEMLTGKTGKDVFDILEQFGLSTAVQPTAPATQPTKPKKLWLKKDDIVPLHLLDQLIFCDAKRINREALMSIRPFRHAKQPWVLLPAFDPSDMVKACGWIRVGLDGRKVEIKYKEDGEIKTKLEKYPVVKGSSPGLLGLHKAALDTSGTIIYAEGWRDLLAALSLGFNAVCNSQGAKTWCDSWLPLFKDKTVYVILDRDEAGVHGANKVAVRIATVAKEVHIVELPYEYQAKDGKDLYDFVTEAINHE
ncbi:MAG TPA: toprim domain-containing protein [Sedimentisphaerales bacterium]|nr:toprim domain-containing protein [Sedimentisphaerales bacterium]